MAHKQPFGIIDVVLVIGIIALTVALVLTIYLPGQKMAMEEDYKWEARARMVLLRTAETQFYSAKQTYTANMDTLLAFAQDSIPASRRDSLFATLTMGPFSFDSLRVNPKSQMPFILAVDDTTSVPRYQITDPDGYGYVSSLSNPDEHNKASWEQ